MGGVKRGNSVIVSRKRGPKRRTRFNRTLLTLHKWAGLTAGAWLLVLGVSGILLDHDEWRWQRQVTVPESWLSKRVARLLPATVMRYVAVDEAIPNRWLGGSERGLWLTLDGGESWSDVSFPEGDTPQVLRFARPSDGSLDGIIVATDDGLWRTIEGGRGIERYAMEGLRIGSLTSGSRPDELVGIVNHERIFRISRSDPSQLRWLSLDQVTISGLPKTVSVYDFVFDLHFGYGLFGRTASTLINDLGGLALAMLAISGFLYWWLPWRWRRGPGPAPPLRRATHTWLFRTHATVFGLLALVPIVYLSITGILLDHVTAFGSWSRDVSMARTSLTPAYQYRSLGEELEQVVAYPGQPQRLSVTTRLGLLHTFDGGGSWVADAGAGTQGGNLFRVRDRLVLSNNRGDQLQQMDGEPNWTRLLGPTTMVSDGVLLDSVLYLKNSRGFYRETTPGEFELTAMKSPKLKGATFYLFVVDVHTGNVIHEQFKWINDLVGALAMLLALSGPVLWWRWRNR